MEINEQKLREKGYIQKWSLDETLKLLEDPQNIPYLGVRGTEEPFITDEYAANFEPLTEENSLAVFLSPEDRASENTVRNCYAMLDCLDKNNRNDSLTTTFYNWGTSHMHEVKGPFLSIDIKTPHNREHLNFFFSSNSPREYYASWESPNRRLFDYEKEMQKFRGPNIR